MKERVSRAVCRPLALEAIIKGQDKILPHINYYKKEVIYDDSFLSQIFLNFVTIGCNEIYEYV